jgi:hypothetical protein
MRLTKRDSAGILRQSNTCGLAVIVTNRGRCGVQHREHWRLDMSFLGTRIMAAGLVDDGIAVEAMETQLAELRALVASNKPVCPICRTEMRQQNYQGYYESFGYWGCDCVEFPSANTWSGAYA